MEDVIRPLTGVKVVEMAQMVAVPAAGRFLADMGAEVVKIEPPKGDGLRYAGPAEGRPAGQDENTTWDFENTGKKLISIDVRTPKGREILDKLLSEADILLTNWRPQALERHHLTYEDLKEKYPKLVYGTLNGYGDKGDDKELPGYDFTAFFARGGWTGSFYQKGGYAPTWCPGLGDHQACMVLSAGVLAALHRAQATGQGEKVSISLMHCAIFMQAIPIQASQYYPNYGAQIYPIDRVNASSPLIPGHTTKDGRFLQVTTPQWDVYFEKLMKTIGREDLIGDERYATVEGMDKHGTRAEMCRILDDAFAQKTLAEWDPILREADLPYAPCQTWDEVLKDKQAWDTDCFYEMDYPRGPKTLIRTPVDLKETPLPPYNKAGYVGQHTAEVLKDLGYSDDDVKELVDEKVAVCYEG